MGAFLELAFVNDLMGENAADEGHKNWHQVSISKMAAAIKLIGAEHFVLSTDLGRKPDPLPAEGYKLYRFRLHHDNKIESTVNTQPLSFSTPTSTVNSQQSTVNNHSGATGIDIICGKIDGRRHFSARN